MLLHDFLKRHRQTILDRSRERANERNAPVVTQLELTDGLPLFLDQLGDLLRAASTLTKSDDRRLQASASAHGEFLFRRGLTVAQVVHDYGDLCQTITSLAVELEETIAADEFKLLNLSLDDAIAGAVTEYERQRERETESAGTERLGVLAHEMRNLISAAILSFGSIKRGVVPTSGSTGAIHERSLWQLSTLIDRSLAQVRLDVELHSLEPVTLWQVIEEVEISGTLRAQALRLRFAVAATDPSVVVKADRQILTAALSNLVQNAFKFTRPGTTVQLRTIPSPARVLVEVEDECGGLPEGAAQQLMKPFVQKGRDRSGLGLGLSICVRAMKAIGGELRIRDLPGKGCVFTLDLPRQPSHPALSK
jgi:signal transduction histidine kinase